MEKDFGITEYACGGRMEPVPCLLKEMFSDFIVQEILADQHVLTIPSPDTIIESTGKKEVIMIQEDVEKPAFLTDELVAQLDERFAAKGPPVVISVEKLEKDERKQIHLFVRERYAGKLMSEMKDDGILVSHGHTNSTRKRKIWDDNIPKECHFTMCKENKETSYALGILAKFLGVKQDMMKTHGIKDKRGVTAQRVSCRQVLESKVLGLNSTLRGILVYDCEYKNEPLQMGGHWGNRFSIVLRNVPTESEPLLHERLESFQNTGFINYFGTQRFGSRESPTSEIGLAILKRDWEKAVKMILKNSSLPKHLDFGTTGAAIRCFEETGNPKWAYSKLKGAQAFATTEAAIFKCLSRDGTWQQAITEAIPQHTRSLYVHAYQSLLWNHAASRRVKENGIHVQENDVGVDGKPLGEHATHYDIHIPLPGENEAFEESYGCEWIKEMLEKDGLTVESFTSLKDRFSLGEASRPLFAEAKDLKWTFIHYTEPRCMLQDGLKTRAISHAEQVGPLLALQLQFSLGSGSYATVALREVTGNDMGKYSMKNASEKARVENEKAEARKEREAMKKDEPEEVKDEPEEVKDEVVDE